MNASEPSEEELRAAYEAELKQITVADVVLQTVVSLVNLAGRRLALAPDTQDELDPDQARDAIDAVRGLLPVLERQPGAQLRPIRDALSQLQMAYANKRGPAAQDEGAQATAGAGGQGAQTPDGGVNPPAGGDAPASGPGPGPAQSSGRLWVPGQ